MGRSKRSTLDKNVSKSSAASGSVKGAQKEHDPAALLKKAEAILSDGNEPELAMKFAQKAAVNSQQLSQGDQTKLHEIMGICLLESGEDDKAKRLFQACSGQSAIALLYLAQLADSPEDALLSFQGAVELLSRRLDLSNTADSNGKHKAWSPQQNEDRIQITRALVGMTELYLTDLSQDPEAETKCSELLDLALRVDGGDDINPEIYSTLANVRISQMRHDDALQALKKSYSIWQGAILADPDEEHPATPLIPPYPARLAVVRLFLECEAYEEAIEILGSCEEEDDEDLEMLYLLGLVYWLIGEGEKVHTEQRDAFLDSREALERFLKIAKRKADECDPEMLAQVAELVGRLETEKYVTLKDVRARDEADVAAVEGADDDTWEDVDEDADEDMS